MVATGGRSGRMLTADTIGFFILALFGFAIGGILYLSERRAPTEERKYIYSPTYAPTKRTPKRAFAAFACAVGLTMIAWGFHDYIHPAHPLGTSTISAQAMRVLDPLDHIILWVVLAILIGALLLFIWTTQPLEDDLHNSGEPPQADGFDEKE